MLSKAFSLVELLVVVTIIAILSAVSIPAYNRYIVRAHVIELLTVADIYKVKLIENFLLAASSTDSVYNLDTAVIEHVTVRTLDTQPVKHVVQVVAKMKAKTQAGIGLIQPERARGPLTIQLHGNSIGEVIVWSCHVEAEYYEYVPNSCHDNNLEPIRIT